MLTKLKQLFQTEIDPAFAKRAELIFEEIYKRKPRNVLDVGCGRGFYLYGLSLIPFVREIHGIDVNEEYLKIAKNNCKDKRIKISKGSIYSLPYKNRYFDAIICSEVLEHLKEDSKALLELKRVLKKDGILLITVPNYNFPFFWDPLNWILMKLFNIHIPKHIWWLAGIWADHVRLYKAENLKKLLKKTDYKIEKNLQIIFYCWPFTHFLLYGIGKNIIEKFGVSNFNRFRYTEKKTLSKLIAKLVGLPSALLDSRIKGKSSMNIYIVAVNK